MWLDVSSFFLLRDPKRNSQNIFCTKVDWWGICGEQDTKARVSGCLEGEGVWYQHDPVGVTTRGGL